MFDVRSWHGIFKPMGEKDRSGIFAAMPPLEAKNSYSERWSEGGRSCRTGDCASRRSC